jgi:transposase-like protein
VALEALRSDRTIQEIAAKHQLHPNQVSQWKRQAMDGLNAVFADRLSREADHEAEKAELHAKIGVRPRAPPVRASGRTVVANDFLSRALGR